MILMVHIYFSGGGSCDCEIVIIQMMMRKVMISTMTKRMEKALMMLMVYSIYSLLWLWLL